MPPRPIKTPTMVIYWADTRLPLTYQEKREVEETGTLTCLSPVETIIQARNGRRVVMVGTTDPHAPPLPTPRMGLA
jgi:hypothetical protein